ncbi:MAG: EF-hand domain-containing protein [Candidatus Eremiobacterota bacterium]
MLTSVQKRKLSTQFNLLDADGNGLLEEADFLRIAHELARAQGLQDEARATLEQRYRHLWDSLAAACDTDGDGRVTIQEWLDRHDALMQEDCTRRVSEPGYRSPFESTARFFFDLLDANSDGRLSRSEYRAFCAAHGLPGEVADQAYDRVVAPGSSLLREELVDMVLEFYFGDEQTTGTWLFGPLES